jgi:hypothetical protein
VNKENIQKHHFFFTGKLRKEAHFLAFSWEKFLPGKENGEIFVLTEIFRRANSPVLLARRKGSGEGKRSLFSYAKGLFRGRLNNA